MPERLPFARAFQRRSVLMSRAKTKVSKLHYAKGHVAVDKFCGGIREARVHAGISQHELARRVGVDPSYISYVERNMREPSLSFLLTVCDVLGASLTFRYRKSRRSQKASVS